MKSFLLGWFLGILAAFVLLAIAGLCADPASAQLATQAVCQRTAWPPTTIVRDGAWWRCSGSEGSICPFEGTAEVRYGELSTARWRTATLPGPVSCSNEVFGDPAPGAGKTCWTQAPIPAADAGRLPLVLDGVFGRCLFNSRTDFGQEVNGVAAACASCHTSNGSAGTDGASVVAAGTRPVRINGALRFRQVPNLRNVMQTGPLGWDGRHGGVSGDRVSMRGAITLAAGAAIASHVEMRGVAGSTAFEKLPALVTFLVMNSEAVGTRVPSTPPNPTQGDLDRIKAGSDLWHGRSVLGQALAAEGRACFQCHGSFPAMQTTGEVTTNVFHPAAAWDFGAKFVDGTHGARDPGAGHVEVCDELGRGCVQVGRFKVPSVWRMGTSGPFMHDGAIKGNNQLEQFYVASLGIGTRLPKFGPLEAIGTFDYWPRFCLGAGPQLDPAVLPVECP